jgi:uncharacterized protein (UPF0212 family)
MSETLQYIRTDEGHFQCPHCDKICEKQNTMYYHVKTIHMNEYKFSCKICADSNKPMNFLQKSAYLKHVATKHPEIAEKEKNPYVGISHKCPSCNHENSAKANVIVHYARHHCKDWIPGFAKGTPCKGCEKVFPSSTAYLYHALTCIKPIPEHHASIVSRIK